MPMDADTHADTYVFSGIYMKTPHWSIKERAILMAQKEFGDKNYLRFGLGVSNKTELNTILNFCTSFGRRFRKIDINYTHCSNAKIRNPNSGIDLISVGYRK